MDTVFLSLLNRSISAGWLVLAVLLLRPVLKKAPKSIRCVLWGLVGLRLVWPFSIESMVSLLPSAQPFPREILFAAEPAIDSGVAALDRVVNPVLAQSSTPMAVASVNPLQIWTWLAGWVWVAGMAVLALYTLVSYLRLRRRVAASVWHRSNIWLCDYIDTPFILGVFRPRIYLPSAMSESQAEQVIAHENAHLSRRDHWWKPLGFALLTVFWFHPLMWVAYVLLCRDIELACDERVVQNMDTGAKKAYSEALLGCSAPRRLIAACPLAFGEVGVKERIRAVLHYKKPAFWVMVAAVAACVITALCFLTDPVGYDAQIRYNGVIWEQSGLKTDALPENSAQVGLLKGIVHRTHEGPEADLHAVNLDEKYAGCPLWLGGDTLYLQDYGWGYLPFEAVERLAQGRLYHLDSDQYAAAGYEGLCQESRLYAFTDDLELMVRQAGGAWTSLGTMEPFRLTKSDLEGRIQGADDGFVSNNVASYYRQATENAWRLDGYGEFYYFWETSSLTFLVYGREDVIQWVCSVLPVVQYRAGRVISAESASAAAEEGSSLGLLGHVTDTLFVNGGKYRADEREALFTAEALSARLRDGGRYWAQGAEIPDVADEDGLRPNVYAFLGGAYRLYQFPDGTCWLSVENDRVVYELEPALQASEALYTDQVLHLFHRWAEAGDADIVACIPFEAKYRQQGLYGVVFYYPEGSRELHRAILPSSGCYNDPAGDQDLLPGSEITYLGDLQVEYFTVDDEGQTWQQVTTFQWDPETRRCPVSTLGTVLAAPEEFSD